ncbi:CCA tRNA nucleotidyltransferase [Halobacillus sp. BBL2006]|uniref:CCA tRNA nucleotidyltransferase n=1 Tax=Halobacillus sp. BBL2006 TaxID=1543706 RepID=UPI0005419CE4|nr:CCA tRNA nucleotidyltransferase [Halobacillus sp. BBL2006]KHE72384.1 CCA-adding protein [Halobacillus sp. BBL2006]
MDPTFKSVFKPAFAIIEKIERHGGEAFIVGGSVRDFLSGRIVGDIDIATSETPQRIQKIFKKVIPVGIEHGTVIVRYEGNSYEVTTYRTEKGYEDFRHPDEVTFVHNIKEDLARRDFTMNAIAMDRRGQIVDPYNGRQAIEQREINAVGNPSERFLEDPLRMMRAVRFASQLNFTIENNTKRAISQQSHLLAHISIERIAEETIKLYKGEGFKLGLELVTDLHLKPHLPHLNQLDLLDQRPKVSLQTWPEVIAYYSFRRSNSSVKEWVEKWKLSNRCRREAESLMEGLEEYERKRSISPWLVYKLPENLFPSFDRLLRAGTGYDQGFLTKMREVLFQLPIRSSNDLAFQAKDLINLYPDQPKGPWISQAVEQMEYSIVESHLHNEYEKIKEWVIRWNPPVNN